MISCALQICLFVLTFPASQQSIVQARAVISHIKSSMSSIIRWPIPNYFSKKVVCQLQRSNSSRPLFISQRPFFLYAYLYAWASFVGSRKTKRRQFMRGPTFRLGLDSSTWYIASYSHSFVRAVATASYISAYYAVCVRYVRLFVPPISPLIPFRFDFNGFI